MQELNLLMHSNTSTVGLLGTTLLTLAKINSKALASSQVFHQSEPSELSELHRNWPTHTEHINQSLQVFLFYFNLVMLGPRLVVSGN